MGSRNLVTMKSLDMQTRKLEVKNTGTNTKFVQLLFVLSFSLGS